MPKAAEDLVGVKAVGVVGVAATGVSLQRRTHEECATTESGADPCLQHAWRGVVESTFTIA